jgi:hypothetical protein
MDDVKVHYNSDKPAQLNALAYAQGTDIHVAPGQEQHLPHETWHVVQQKQGRVQPTMQMQGVNVNVNDNEGLEKEADVMGEKSLHGDNLQNVSFIGAKSNLNNIYQLKVGFEFETGWLIYKKGLRRESIGFDLGFLKVMYIPLRKKELILNGVGYHIEADEAGMGMSEIEFVTDPFDSVEPLNKAMKDINIVGEDLCKNSTPFEKWGFKIIPKDSNLMAKPQMTFGMSLDKLIRLNNFTVDATISKTTHIEGLVTLIKSYIQEGQKNVPKAYPKIIADRLMARTDFGKLFDLAIAVDNVQLSYNDWLYYFSEFNIEDPLFKCRILKNPDYDLSQIRFGTEKGEKLLKKISYQPKVTIKDWLTSIYNKKDDLLKMKDGEGMGALGHKTDLEMGQDVGIFEYRLLHQLTIPLIDWRKFALSWFFKIHDANRL